MELTIDNKTLRYKENGEHGPLIIWAMYPHRENEFEHMWECLIEAVGEKPFCLIAFQAENWNRDFSPWKAPTQMPNEEFEGKGPETLQWLVNTALPALKEHFGDREVILMGYSLAGLFSLWAAYETDAFDAVSCCSGSLWINGWNEYVKSHSLKGDCKVYLSLGGKEEKTNNKMVAQVGNRTRAQEKILKADPHALKVKLEMNPGGHFSDSGKRLAKGIRYFI